MSTKDILTLNTNKAAVLDQMFSMLPKNCSPGLAIVFAKLSQLPYNRRNIENFFYFSHGRHNLIKITVYSILLYSVFNQINVINIA